MAELLIPPPVSPSSPWPLAHPDTSASPTGSAPDGGWGVVPKPTNRAALLRRIWQKTLRKMIRSALYAALARLLFGFLKSIVKGGLSKKMLQLVKGELLSANPWKWAVLVGSLSSYRGVQQMIELILPTVSHPMSCIAAAAVSTLGFFSMNIETRTELALYAAVRAGHGLLVSSVLPRLPPRYQKFQHWDVVTMCLTSIQVAYCLMFENACFEPTYLHFLQRCTTTDVRVLSTVSNLQRQIIAPESISYGLEKGLPLLTYADRHDLKKGCDYLHHGLTCGAATVQYLVRSLTTVTFPLYGSLKLTSILLFGYKRLLRSPLSTLGRALVSVTRSAVFMTLLGCPPFSFICVFANLGIHSPAGIAITSGSLAGLSLLVEGDDRRLDLVLYCSMQTLRATVNLLVRRGWIHRPNRHHITLLTMSAFAALFYQYDIDAESQNPNVKKALAWITAEKVKV
jgi:hypothetical protein